MPTLDSRMRLIQSLFLLVVVLSQGGPRGMRQARSKGPTIVGQPAIRNAGRGRAISTGLLLPRFRFRGRQNPSLYRAIDRTTLSTAPGWAGGLHKRSPGR